MKSLHTSIFAFSSILIFTSSYLYSQEYKHCPNNLDYLHNPYSVVNYNPDYELLISLPNYDHGNLVADVFINKHGKIDGFNIKYLQLLNTSIDTFKYYKYSDKPILKKDYPDEIQIIYNEIKDYIYKLHIVEHKAFKKITKSSYILSLPVKLKIQKIGVLHLTQPEKSSLSLY